MPGASTRRSQPPSPAAPRRSRKHPFRRHHASPREEKGIYRAAWMAPLGPASCGGPSRGQVLEGRRADLLHDGQQLRAGSPALSPLPAGRTRRAPRCRDGPRTRRWHPCRALGDVGAPAEAAVDEHRHAPADGVEDFRQRVDRRPALSSLRAPWFETTIPSTPAPTAIRHPPGRGSP